MTPRDKRELVARDLLCNSESLKRGSCGFVRSASKRLIIASLPLRFIPAWTSVISLRARARVVLTGRENARGGL